MRQRMRQDECPTPPNWPRTPIQHPAAKIEYVEIERSRTVPAPSAPASQPLQSFQTPEQLARWDGHLDCEHSVEIIWLQSLANRTGPVQARCRSHVNIEIGQFYNGTSQRRQRRSEDPADVCPYSNKRTYLRHFVETKFRQAVFFYWGSIAIRLTERQ